MRRHPRTALGLWSSPLSRVSLSPCSRGLIPRFQSSSADDDPNDHDANLRRARRKRAAGTVPLGVEFLGKPGEIVVVSQTRRQIPEHEQSEPECATEEDAPRLTLGSMLGDLDKEQIALTASGLQEAFADYRGRYQAQDKLTASDWEELRSNLASSFKYSQLSDYLAESEKHALESGGKAGQWRPGTSLFLDTTPSGRDRVTDRIAASRDLKGKAFMAERILRDFWKFSITDEIGQLDLRLPSPFIALLLNANHFSFDEVASLHGASIDITRSLGLVRITGKQTACQSIREVILDATARIREQDVGIDTQTATASLGQACTSDFLEWVSKTYGVAFEQASHQVPNKLLYLAENKRGADGARRTLTLAISETKRPLWPFSTYLPASEMASVYTYNPEANASWLDRQKSWFRWAMSTVQTAEAETLPTPFFDSHQTRLSDELLKLLRDTSPEPLSGSNVYESVTAAVGRCLFARKPTFEESVLSAPQLGRLSLPRTFTTEIPRIAPFLDSLSPTYPDDGIRTYCLRLIPSSRYANVAPELDVEIALPAEDNPETADDGFDVRNVNAILSTNSVDYLLPENGLDLRFTRTVYQKLSNEALMQSVEQALQDIRMSNPASRGSVPLPPFCHLSMPSEVVPSSAASNTGDPPTCGQNSHDQSLGSETQNHHVTVEYLFRPLGDIRSAAAQHYDFDGRRLTYRYYESGPFLPARTNEVLLDMELPGFGSNLAQDQTQDSLEQDFHAFYNAACDMAFRIPKARHVPAGDQ